jgi:hypothetical protein
MGFFLIFFDHYITELHGHGIANCFRIFNEQNELADPQKVLYNVNSKFKNLVTKTKEKNSAMSRPRFEPWPGHAGV